MISWVLPGIDILPRVPQYAKNHIEHEITATEKASAGLFEVIYLFTPSV